MLDTRDKNVEYYLSLNSLCLPKEKRFAKKHRQYSIIVIYDLENCSKCSENTNHKKKKEEKTDFTWLK